MRLHRPLVFLGALSGCAQEPEPLAAEADLEALTGEVGALLARVEQLEAQTSTLQADLAASEAARVDLELRLEAAEDGLAACEASAATLEDLGQVLYRDAEGDVVVEGANLRVRNGAGSTRGAQNGKGNLILGYDEKLSGTEGRTGSHNLVIGEGHGYEGEAGVLVGSAHRAKAGVYGQVALGGKGAALTGEDAVAIGAVEAQVGAGSVALGGYSPYVDSGYSVVIGGWDNGSEGTYAVILGGRENYGAAAYGTVLGGQLNSDGSEYTTVVGGYSNAAQAPWALTLGGQGNTTTEEYGVRLP